MEINVRFACCEEYLGKIENGRYEMPENCTIDEALKYFEKILQRKFTENLPDHLAFLVDGKAAQYDQKLTQNSTLIILRKIYGG